MRFVQQCGRCGARDSDPHKEECGGRKVRIPVYGKEDYVKAKEAGFPDRPLNITMADNGGATADRYTIYRRTPTIFVTERARWVGYFVYGAANSYPYHPQGIGMTGETPLRLWVPSYRPHGEKLIKWKAAPEDVRKFAWDLAIDDGEA